MEVSQEKLSQTYHKYPFKNSFDVSCNMRKYTMQPI